MKYDSMAYENPWRTNYESQAAGVWVMAATVSFGVNQLANLPPEPFYWMGGICSVMALSRMPQAIRLATFLRLIIKDRKEWVSATQLPSHWTRIWFRIIVAEVPSGGEVPAAQCHGPTPKMIWWP